MTDVRLRFYSSTNGLSSLHRLTSMLEHLKKSRCSTVRASGDTNYVYCEALNLHVCVCIRNYKINCLAASFKSHSIHAILWHYTCADRLTLKATWKKISSSRIISARHFFSSFVCLFTKEAAKSDASTKTHPT